MSFNIGYQIWDYILNKEGYDAEIIFRQLSIAIDYLVIKIDFAFTDQNVKFHAVIQ